MSMLFDPATLPARDADGYTFHPDLDGRFHRDDFDEYLDSDKFRAHGLETASIDFESDATDDMRERYYELGEHCPDWQPSRPAGDGWRIAGIYDTEDGPCALFVRDITQGGVQ